AVIALNVMEECFEAAVVFVFVQPMVEFESELFELSEFMLIVHSKVESVTQPVVISLFLSQTLYLDLLERLLVLSIILKWSYLYLMVLILMECMLNCAVDSWSGKAHFFVVVVVIVVLMNCSMLLMATKKKCFMKQCFIPHLHCQCFSYLKYWIVLLWVDSIVIVVIVIIWEQNPGAGVYCIPTLCGVICDELQSGLIL
ncbi:MAG: hypothetical protein EZS28_051693, partial [Streblomastix strix]